MGNKNNDGITKFLIIIITVAFMWSYLLKDISKGYFGFRLIMLYSGFISIQYIVHNIHCGKILSLQNPFLLLLIFGGYYLINKFLGPHLIKYGIFLICGIDWFLWFDKSSFFRFLITPKQQAVNTVFMIISFIPYFVLFKAIKNKKKEEC